MRPAAPQPPRWRDSVTQLAGSGALCLLNLQLILLVGRGRGEVVVVVVGELAFGSSLITDAFVLVP